VSLKQPLRAARTATAAVPLRIKLVATVLVLAAVGLAVAATATTTSLHRYLLNRVDDQLGTFVNSFGIGTGGQQFGISGGPGFVGGPTGSPRHHGALPSQFYVLHFLPNGTPDGSSYVQLTSQSPPSLPLLTTARATALSHHPFTVSSVNGKSSWRVVTMVQPDGSGTVAVAESLSDVDHTVNHVILLEGGIGLVALVLMGLAGYVLISRSLRPLVSVEHTAAAIAAGDLTQRVPELPVRTEVGRLSLALNSMLTQIEDAFSHEHESEQQARASEERMRQFVADASHELRTPLTSIRGFAELFRMGAAGEPADLPRLMSRIENEAARMGLLVDDLLLLARLDQQRPLDHDPVDLLNLAADVVHDAQVIDPDRAITLKVSTSQPPVVIGDESRLRQVLHNLMSNALTHTPSGTPVTVSVHTDASVASPRAVIDVADRGAGVTEEQSRRVFERFYRADMSRSRSGGGSGLGLSIVASLVAAHGGTVSVMPRDGGGAVFKVSLPLAKELAGSSPPLST
jgi:two-component system OmpR family sensor kinase